MCLAVPDGLTKRSFLQGALNSDGIPRPYKFSPIPKSRNSAERRETEYCPLPSGELFMDSCLNLGEIRGCKYILMCFVLFCFLTNLPNLWHKATLLWCICNGEEEVFLPLLHGSQLWPLHGGRREHRTPSACGGL